MQLESGRISSSQLFFIIVGFISGTSLLFPPGISAKHDAWLALLVGLGAGLLSAIVYTILAAKFPRKTLIQMNDIVYGAYLGKLVSIGYLWYFFHTGSTILRLIGDFTLIIMPETPMVVFILFVALICASVVRNGIEVLVRCSVILVIFLIIVTSGTVALLIQDMKFTNLLPILDISLKEFSMASYDAATFPFGQPVVFLMIFAFLNKPEQVKSSTLGGISIGGILLLIVTIQNIAVLGTALTIQIYPTLEAVRLIEVGKIITRLEILVAINLISMVFIKLSVFYYATVLGIAQLLKMRSYLPLVLPIGVFLINESILQFDNIIESIFFTTNIWPFYSTPFQYGLPILTAVITVFRGLPKKGEAK